MSVKITLIGRPGTVQKQATFVGFTLNSATHQMPPPPKGLPPLRYGPHRGERLPADQWSRHTGTVTTYPGWCIAPHPCWRLAPPSLPSSAAVLMHPPVMNRLERSVPRPIFWRHTQLLARLRLPLLPLVPSQHVRAGPWIRVANGGDRHQTMWEEARRCPLNVPEVES